MKAAPECPADADAVTAMEHRLQTAEGKTIYGKRKATVETVFGVIKEVLGFRRFHLRGLRGAEGRMEPGVHGVESEADVCPGERLTDDKRWRYGVPPKANANFAWVQHIVHHLAPGGTAGFVLANGSMSSNQSGEGEIRKKLIEADLVDCMVALPGQLFYSTQIPACLWFLTRDRCGGQFRDRRGEVLSVDARKLGRMVDRTHRELTDEDITRIADTYHAWRGDEAAGVYADIPGFCKSTALEDLRRHGHVLTPGRYVGVEALKDDGEPFEQKMRRLVAELEVQQAEGVRLDAAIAGNLNTLGFGLSGSQGTSNGDRP